MWQLATIRNNKKTEMNDTKWCFFHQIFSESFATIFREANDVCCPNDVVMTLNQTSCFKKIPSGKLT
jgi:hypothetical protein